MSTNDMTTQHNHCRSRSLVGSLSAALALGAGLACVGARAEPPALQTATCNVKGSVTLTVAGVSTTTPLPCVNPTAQDAPGGDESELVGTTTLGVAPVAELTSVSAPFGYSGQADLPEGTAMAGLAGASNVDLLQDGVMASDVAGILYCTNPIGSSQVDCQVSMTLSALQVGGQSVPIPPQPIPINTRIPVVNLRIDVAVPLLGTLRVPLNGTLTLNQVVVTDTVIEHAPIALDVSGGLEVLGIGMVAVKIRLEDYSELEYLVGSSQFSARSTNMIYDYCADLRRFPGSGPDECDL